MKTRILLLLTLIFIPIVALSQALPPSEGGTLSFPTHPWQTDDVTWTTLESAPQAFCRSGSAVLGDYLYIFGSYDGNIAYAFNLTTEQWEESTPALYGNYNWCAVATNEQIYLVGRYLNSSYGNEFQRFTPEGAGPTGNWELMADYPIEVCGIAADWDGGNYIYTCGGGGTGGSSFLAYRYNISDDRWENIANLPVLMKYHGGAFIEGKFHVVGGYQSPNAHYAYNPDTDLWTEKADPLVDQYFGLFNTTDNGSNIITIAGLAGYSPTNQVQYYNPQTDSWTMESAYPFALYANSVEDIGEGIVVSVGGYNNGNVYNYTCKGEGFPTGQNPLTISINLIPYVDPIIIPPGGAPFQFTAQLQNCTSDTFTFDVWTEAVLHNGRIYGPLIYHNLLFPPLCSASRDYGQMVPANAPPGDYLFRGMVGVYPDTVWDADEFEFEKVE